MDANRTRRPPSAEVTPLAPELLLCGGLFMVLKDTDDLSMLPLPSDLQCRPPGVFAGRDIRPTGEQEMNDIGEPLVGGDM